MDWWPTFREALDTAIVELGRPYFQVRRHAMEAEWRERAYCYELYHLLRCHLPAGFPFTLHGEIDKAGHEEITRHFGRRQRPNPDFVVHVPGEFGRAANLAVIEVKRSDADIKLVQEDLWKIRKFLSDIEYQHGLMLFFGTQQPPHLYRLGAIEALWHNCVGAKPVVSKKGKFN
jgi:hypothetical protein